MCINLKQKIMLQAIKKLLGIGPKPDLTEVMSRGAVIVDVRTPGEYAGGHLKGSINIPLNILQSQLSRLKKDKPIITCCASGMRSASARSMLVNLCLCDRSSTGAQAKQPIQRAKTNKAGKKENTCNDCKYYSNSACDSMCEC